MRGAGIQIGVGALVAGVVGFWNDAAAFGLLIFVGGILLAHGVYDDFIKPRFRVEHRLMDWFLRRGWSVRLERRPQFNFLLQLSSGSSEYNVIVTRDKRTDDDLLGFTGKVPMHPMWLEVLPGFSQSEREVLLSEIRIYVTAKNLSFNFVESPDGGIVWPPTVIIQAAIAQDHTLSQHSVDMMAKSVELTMIGVRDVIRKAVIVHRVLTAAAAQPDDDDVLTPTPFPESIPGTAPQRQ